VGHSAVRIPEKPLQSIGSGTGVSGVGSSEPTRQRVRRGDRPLRTPETPVPSCCSAISLGAESQEPVSPVAPDAEGGGHSDRREAFPSLVGGTPNAHKYLGVPLVLVPGPRRLLW